MKFVEGRFSRHDPWGLPATIASIGILFGSWFFLGVLQDIVVKDPLVILNIRFHNTVPLFRSTGMTWFMLTLTQFGSTTVLSLLCIEIASIAIANQQRRLAVTFLIAFAATGIVSTTLKAL